MEDMVIICIQCENEFRFSIEEKQKFQLLGFDEPQRCPGCRKNKSKTIYLPENRRVKDKKRHYRQKYDEAAFDF
ncbi:MAG: zinc-ribbon domain containing protein [Deltaproteobacteria bacterium]|nr:zinc-ribbon domain containing protein [Deltaproteobacteria bacterium]